MNVKHVPTKNPTEAVIRERLEAIIDAWLRASSAERQWMVVEKVRLEQMLHDVRAHNALPPTNGRAQSQPTKAMPVGTNKGRRKFNPI
jgi:hypothetical protein